MSAAGEARTVLRRCLVSREPRDARELIRFVIGPDGQVVPDLARKLPGRGLWVEARRPAVARAAARQLFAKAARAPAKAPADLADRVERLLAARCLETLGLARRAGEAVLGFEKVRAALQRGEVAVLLTARDAGPDGRRKLAARGEVRPCGLFDRAELSLAFGRENVVHAALRRGGLAARFLDECVRLSGFRPATEAEAQAIVASAAQTVRPSEGQDQS